MSRSNFMQGPSKISTSVRVSWASDWENLLKGWNGAAGGCLIQGKEKQEKKLCLWTCVGTAQWPLCRLQAHSLHLEALWGCWTSLSWHSLLDPYCDLSTCIIFSAGKQTALHAQAGSTSSLYPWPCNVVSQITSPAKQKLHLCKTNSVVFAPWKNVVQTHRMATEKTVLAVFVNHLVKVMKSIFMC